jgi:hypothetical protein
LTLRIIEFLDENSMDSSRAPVTRNLHVKPGTASAAAAADEDDEEYLYENDSGMEDEDEEGRGDDDVAAAIALSLQQQQEDGAKQAEQEAPSGKAAKVARLELDPEPAEGACYI